MVFVPKLYDHVRERVDSVMVKLKIVPFYSYAVLYILLNILLLIFLTKVKQSQKNLNFHENNSLNW